MTAETIKCECGTSFEWEGMAEELATFKDTFRPKHCDSCNEIIEAARAKENEAIHAAKRAQWVKDATERAERRLEESTPARYRATDCNHAGFNLELWNRVKKWRPSAEAPWLGLVGASGGCKTRISYLLLRELIRESIEKQDGESAFIVATSYSLSEAVRNQYDKRVTSLGGSSTGTRAREFLDDMATVKILMLDDLGKAKNTPAVAAELFAIIDRRHAHNLTTIWTANSTPEEIVNGMSADMAGPLAGRLIECSQILTIE